ncbi:MAG TPA: hypothetical protein VEV87_06460, partial [Chitinophagaceae bacterium]|nr:hypothetical protein [Chitinophagaceae bacterium]
MKLNIQSIKFSYCLLRTETHRWLASSMMFSLLLVVIRIFYTGSLTFIFLSWNLFLAFIPYVISSFLEKHPGW